MCEQTTAVPLSYIGLHITDVEIDMQQVDDALRFVFDLSRTTETDEDGGSALSW